MLKPLVWNLGKNSKLKEDRGISFEEVQECILRGAFIIGKVQSKNYPNQGCFFVTIRRKRWTVPFKEYQAHIFLFTIFPRV